MRLTNPNDMVRALQEGRVTRWEVSIYCFIYIISLLLLILSWDLSPYSSKSLWIIDALIALCLELIAVVGAYIINKKGDGHNFWKRLFSLSASLVFYQAIIALFVAFVFVPLIGVLDPDYAVTEGNKWQDVVITNMLAVFFLVYLFRLMQHVSSVLKV